MSTFKLNELSIAERLRLHAAPVADSFSAEFMAEWATKAMRLMEEAADHLDNTDRHRLIARNSNLVKENARMQARIGELEHKVTETERVLRQANRNFRQITRARDDARAELAAIRGDNES